MTNCADRTRLKRAYDRNLGYARLWLGAGMGIIAVASAFFANWATQPPASPATPAAAAPAGANITIVVIVALFGLAAGVCFLIAFMFRHFYRRADAALAEPAEEKG